MNTNTIATVTPKKAATNGSLRTAAGLKASGQPAVSFAPHDAPSNAEPPASKKAPGTSASALKKRTEKLGATIVELIESQELRPLTTYIFNLAMEMVAANAHYLDRASSLTFPLHLLTTKSGSPATLKGSKLVSRLASMMMMTNTPILPPVARI
jgi:hypothetical protein